MGVSFAHILIQGPPAWRPYYAVLLNKGLLHNTQKML